MDNLFALPIRRYLLRVSSQRVFTIPVLMSKVTIENNTSARLERKKCSATLRNVTEAWRNKVVILRSHCGEYLKELTETSATQVRLAALQSSRMEIKC